LQKELKEDEREITDLEGTLSKAQEEYQNMFDAMKYKAAKYEVRRKNDLMMGVIISDYI
jgi:DNA gyrase/topoisomerase IV subunit A